MVKIQSKKSRRYNAIKDGLNLGMSGNRIYKMLQETGLGMNKKKFYQEVRAIQGKTLTKEKREKSIPKKYRKGHGGIIRQKIGYIYRGSLIISSIPFHSRPFDRHYLGFRLNIFSYSKNEVYNAMKSLRKMFIEKVGDKLKSFNYANEQTLGTENPTKINLTNPDNYNGKWFFAVEEKGKDIGSDSGYI